MTKNNKKWYAYERQSHYSLDKPSITIAANCIFFNSALVKKMGLKNFKSIRIEFDDQDPSKATAIRLVGNNDGSQDLVSIFSDVDTNDRPDDGSFIDLIENVEEIDRIYIMGNSSTDHLDFIDKGDFIDIYHNDAHEARLLETELTAGQVQDITSFF